ncbi:hypothetical protein IEE_05493 [Bacillus cereus BAG5X1-1]|uniref:Uncharacterized protein n=1 Tax=Bacillus cereus BAG5X1-1 TaxID=1053189 RepID=J7ZYM2_BACCE|nr:hypothetical protein [Bacillus cereus]EJQ36017.1 hypothetical protein IEE_05493 [Bacillus cereus BAG5X1-1]
MEQNTIQTENILLITPSEWDMILKKEKLVVFQNEISEKLKQEINNYAPETIYLKDIDTGEILGEATSYLIFYLLYDFEKERGYRKDSNFEGVVKERNDALRYLYNEWCYMKSLKPNPNEGWFKSKKFSKYLDHIGWGSNYAVFIHEVIKY